MALTQQTIDDATVNIEALNQIMEGGPGLSVTMANGRIVPSISKVIADGQMFKGPAIVWPPGGTVSDALQVYTDGTLNYSPIPSTLPFSGTGAFPTATMQLVQGFRPKSVVDTDALIDLTTTLSTILTGSISGTIINASSRITVGFSATYGNTGTDTADPFAVTIQLLPNHASTPSDNVMIVTEQQSDAGVFAFSMVGSFDAINGANQVDVKSDVNWLGNPVGGRVLTLLNATLVMQVEIT